MPNPPDLESEAEARSWVNIDPARRVSWELLPRRIRLAIRRYRRQLSLNSPSPTTTSRSKRQAKSAPQSTNYSSDAQASAQLAEAVGADPGGAGLQVGLVAVDGPPRPVGPAGKPNRVRVRAKSDPTHNPDQMAGPSAVRSGLYVANRGLTVLRNEQLPAPSADLAVVEAQCRGPHQ